ncbi:hypothetical protein SAMN05444484_1091, partial [Flavobacterium chilense]
MYYTSRLKLILIILLIPFSIQSQITKDLPNYFPVSPNAASFAKQGLYPVDYSTGKLNVSVPIYTIKTKELTVPISLNYNTSGIQLNETASWVGLGWNLNAGGAIVRNTKGRPDGSLGSQSNWKPIPALSSNFAFTKENYRALYDMQKGERDSAPDEYVVNAPGLSGSFYFDQNDSYKAYFRDFQNTKVKIISNTEIEITKDDGTIYKFGKNLQGIDVLEITSNPSELVQSLGMDFISAWYLTEIISANGKEKIAFQYKSINSADYPVITSERLDFDSPTTFLIRPNYPTGNGYLAPIQKQFLQTITFPNGKVDFISTLDRQDLADDYKLNAIEISSVQNNQNTSIQKYSFSYDYYSRSGGQAFSTSYTDPLANNARIQNSKVYALRLKEVLNNKTNTKYSFQYNSSPIFRRGTTSQDYWGYMNGNTGSLMPPTTIPIKAITSYPDITFGNGNRAGDENIMKSGILEKITYPEGGYSVFEYEANRYIKNITSTTAVDRSLTVRADGTGNNCNVHYGEDTVVVGPNYILGSGKIFYYISPAKNENGPNSYVKYGNTTIYRLNYDSGLQQYPTSSGTINNIDVSGIVLKAADFRSGVTGPTGCPFLNITASWKEATGTIVTPTTIFVGGLRIKSIKNYLPGATLPETQKQYVYEQENLIAPEGAGTYKRGIIETQNQSIVKPICSSSTIYNNNIGGGPGMTYGKVTEIDINKDTAIKNGKIEYFYENIPALREIDFFPTIYKHPQYNDTSIQFSNGLVPFATQISDFAYYKNDTWNYGSLIKTKYYKNDTSNTFKIVKNIDNTYQKLIEKKIPYDIVFSIFEPPFDPGNNYVFPTTPYDQSGDFYSYQFFYFTGSTTFGKKVLTSTIETDYDVNEAPTTQKTTNYGYENPAHYQLTKTETFNSKNEVLRTQLSYPQDLVSTGQTAEMQKLITQNKIDKPVKTETFVNNVQTSESITKYEESSATGNVLLPKEIHSSKGAVETFPFDNSNRKVNFVLYDSDLVSGVSVGNGNVIEYSLENGTPVSIIWGYNKTQPIAKIENATYSEVSSYVVNLQDKSNTATETELINALNSLRTALPNAMITTYTYIPLVGVSTITDPKGDKITYT